MNRIIKGICISILAFVIITYLFFIELVSNEVGRLLIGLLSIGAFITLVIMKNVEKKSL